jgi:LAS superfamily LD-carboxypeptidase LdcB
MLTPEELTGRSRSHVVQHDELRAAVHADVLEPLLALRAAAAQDGIDLQIASSFRDIDAQLRIWNMKYRGERPLYDREGNVREHAALDEEQLVDGILCWSALPGASRHHWGTDIDVIDRAALPPEYRYQLVPEEFSTGGVFYALHTWLDANIARFGFFRPYAGYRGGVYPEPWHLSYGEVAVPALAMLTEDLVAQTLCDIELLGKEQVLARLPAIYRQYVLNISAPTAFA